MVSRIAKQAVTGNTAVGLDDRLNHSPILRLTDDGKSPTGLCALPAASHNAGTSEGSSCRSMQAVSGSRPSPSFIVSPCPRQCRARSGSFSMCVAVPGCPNLLLHVLAQAWSARACGVTRCVIHHQHCLYV